MIFLHLFFLFSISLVICLALTPLLIRFSHQLHLLDVPDCEKTTDSTSGAPRKVHKTATPKIGGVAIILGVCVSLVVSPLIEIDKTSIMGALLSFYIPSLFIFITGLVDDLKPLSAKLRLFVQIALASSMTYLNNLAVYSVRLWGDYAIELPYFVGFVLAVFIIVGAVNSLNFIDGLDGLAGGIVFISVSLLSYLYFVMTQDVIAILYIGVPILGALLGFLKFNSNPASIFMGDNGSNWLGFMIGSLMLVVLKGAPILETLSSSGHVSSYKAPLFLSVIFCFAIPIFDTLMVILARIYKGSNPMTPDKSHFHHHLLRFGLDQKQSVMTIYFLAVVWGVMDILPEAIPAYSLEWLLVIALLGLPYILLITMRAESSAIPGISLPIANAQEKTKGVVNHWLKFNRKVLYIILLLMPFFSRSAPEVLGKASLISAGVLFISLPLPIKRNYFISYLVVILSCYTLLATINTQFMLVRFDGVVYNIQFIYNNLYYLLLISSLAYVAFGFKRQYLKIIPEDLLFIIIPVLLILIPEPWSQQFHLNIISARALIIFFAMRILVADNSIHFRKIKWMLMFSLVYVGLTSVYGLRVIQ